MHDVVTKSLTQTADRIVTREVRGEEKELIKVPISSTRADRDGDEFSKSALDGMAKQIRHEQPKLFQNHGFTDFYSPLYDDRETIGTHVDAEVVAYEADDEDHVLNAFILPDLSHPEGERMLDQVQQGHAEKFSVGFRVHEAEPKNPESESDERRIFQAVDHMETSKVGIPSNPDASAAVAVKAAGLAERLDAAEFDLDAAEFASALAGELVRASGPVTRETVEAATPVRIDGSNSTVTRRDVLGAATESPMTTRETREEGDPCDDNGDCGDGMVCVDGECVPEDEEESARLSRLESRFASLEETITDALGDGGEPPDDDTAAEPPTETFSVEIDGEDREFSPDDIRELAQAADDGEPAESQTVTDPEAHDGTEVDETADDTPDETNDTEPNTEQSLQEEVYQ